MREASGPFVPVVLGGEEGDRPFATSLRVTRKKIELTGVRFRVTKNENPGYYFARATRGYGTLREATFYAHA